MAMIKRADDACRRINDKSLARWDNRGLPLRGDLKEGRTRSGRLYQRADGPLSREGGLENYLQGIRGVQYETGWNNFLQKYLASEKQFAIRPDYIDYNSLSKNPDGYHSGRPVPQEVLNTPTSQPRGSALKSRARTPTRMLAESIRIQNGYASIIQFRQKLWCRGNGRDAKLRSTGAHRPREPVSTGSRTRCSTSRTSSRR